MAVFAVLDSQLYSLCQFFVNVFAMCRIFRVFAMCRCRGAALFRRTVLMALDSRVLTMCRSGDASFVSCSYDVPYSRC